jgi:hypothetical protein
MLRLVVPKLITRVTSQALKMRDHFFTYKVFVLIEPMLILHS